MLARDCTTLCPAGTCPPLNGKNRTPCRKQQLAACLLEVGELGDLHAVQPHLRSATTNPALRGLSCLDAMPHASAWQNSR